MIYYLVLVLALISLTACDETGVANEAAVGSSQVTGEGSPSAPGNFAGEVMETVNAAGYTYALIETGQGNVWVAGPQTAV